MANCALRPNTPLLLTGKAHAVLQYEKLSADGAVILISQRANRCIMKFFNVFLLYL